MGKHIYIFFFVQFRFDQGLSVTRSTPGMILFEYTGLLLFLPEAKTAATNLSFSFSFFLFYFIFFFLRKERSRIVVHDECYTHSTFGFFVFINLAMATFQLRM